MLYFSKETLKFGFEIMQATLKMIENHDNFDGSWRIVSIDDGYLT